MTSILTANILCTASSVSFLFLFVRLNIHNIWHFRSTTALSFGSVCTSHLSLAAHTYKNPTRGMFGSLPAVGLIQSRIIFSIQLCYSSLGSRSRSPHSDCLRPLIWSSLECDCCVLTCLNEAHQRGNTAGFDPNRLNVDM